MKTHALVFVEMREVLNGVRRTAKSASLLGFYAVMVCGGIFISWVLGQVASAGSMLASVPVLLRDYLTVESVATVLGLVMASSLISGMFGSGTTSVLRPPDEFALMPAPVGPHQIFVARYARRILRKLTIALIIVLVLYPMTIRTALSLGEISLAVLGALGLLEFVFLLSLLGYTLRHRASGLGRLKKLAVYVCVGCIALALVHPATNSNPVLGLLLPSSLISLVALSAAGILQTQFLWPLMGLIGIDFLIMFLVVTVSVERGDYERYIARPTPVSRPTRLERAVRGEVDFSQSRFSDPMMWVILKDFWTRMRSPLQFAKYVSAAGASVVAVLLWVVFPYAATRITLPVSTRNLIPYAFFLVEMAFLHVASTTSLLSFSDERENIYLLRVSPLPRSSVVLAKFVGSLVESLIASVPALLLLAYFVTFDGVLSLVVLALPLLSLFCATGTMIGAYIPVFTNEPSSPPIPLVFAFPVINLALGGLLGYFVLQVSGLLLILAIPLFVLAAVWFFLSRASRALLNYR